VILGCRRTNKDKKAGNENENAVFVNLLHMSLGTIGRKLLDMENAALLNHLLYS
jgi:hypothetical protein